MTDFINEFIHLIEAMIWVGSIMMVAGLIYVTIVWAIRKWN